MSYTLRSNGKILDMIESFTDAEALINFTAGAILGKNRRASIVGADDENELYEDIHQIMTASSRRLRLLTRRRWATAADLGGAR